MKIAIFGDSFADDHVNWIDQGRWLDVGPSWVDFLRNFYEVDNFATGGSCLYFSKIKFDECDLSAYDKIIYIVTDPHRRYNYGRNWNNGNVQRELAKSNLPVGLKEELIALRYFFTYVFNESDLYFHNLMVEDIKQKYPSVLFLDYDLLNRASNNECKQLTNGKLEVWEVYRQGNSDARKCHLCEENNLILGKQIQHCLENNLDLDIDIEKFVTPPRELDYYFRKVV